MTCSARSLARTGVEGTRPAATLSSIYSRPAFSSTACDAASGAVTSKALGFAFGQVPTALISGGSRELVGLARALGESFAIARSTAAVKATRSRSRSCCLALWADSLACAIGLVR